MINKNRDSFNKYKFKIVNGSFEPFSTNELSQRTVKDLMKEMQGKTGLTIPCSKLYHALAALATGEGGK